MVIKTDGEGSYLSGDLAYYLDKRERGFDRCFIMLGADHHGYVGRMMAMCAAFGDTPGNEPRDPDRADGQPGPGRPAAADVQARRDRGDHRRPRRGHRSRCRPLRAGALQLRLHASTSTSTCGRKQSSDNPVFYVQYAHARLASILRNAADLGLAPAGDDFDPSLLSHEREGDLLRALAEFPRVVASAAQLREPHRVARYLENTASSFHRFYDTCRVLPMGDEEPTDLHRARLLLVDATRTVVANGLALLGVSAPERM